MQGKRRGFTAEGGQACGKRRNEKDRNAPEDLQSQQNLIAGGAKGDHQRDRQLVSTDGHGHHQHSAEEQQIQGQQNQQSIPTAVRLDKHQKAIEQRSAQNGEKGFKAQLDPVSQPHTWTSSPHKATKIFCRLMGWTVTS